MECAPLCKLEWIVEGQVVTGEEEQFTLDMEDVTEDLANEVAMLSSSHEGRQQAQALRLKRKAEAVSG